MLILRLPWLVQAANAKAAPWRARRLERPDPASPAASNECRFARIKTAWKLMSLVEIRTTRPKATEGGCRGLTIRRRSPEQMVDHARSARCGPAFICVGLKTCTVQSKTDTLGARYHHSEAFCRLMSRCLLPMIDGFSQHLSFSIQPALRAAHGCPPFSQTFKVPTRRLILRFEGQRLTLICAMAQDCR